MRMQDALACMEERRGYRVHFEWRKGGVLTSDFFPARDEEPINSEKLAWLVARRFAKAMEREVVNVYVIHAETFKPVGGYEANILNRYN